MENVTVPVKSSLASKVNWIAGLTALVASLNELTDALNQLMPFVPPQYQHYVTVGIVIAGGIATIITRSFFTTSVTTASMKGPQP